MLIIMIILLIILLLFLIYKKKDIIKSFFIQFFAFLKKNKINIFFGLFLFIVFTFILIKNSLVTSVSALDEKAYAKIRADRINMIKNYVKKKSRFFTDYDHDFSIKKTNALNILLDYQISHLDDFEIQYIQITGCKSFTARFDYNIGVLLSEFGEYGKALQQCSLIIEDVFKELSNTPGLARRKMEQRQQIKFQEGEVLERKLVDEVFDNYAKFIYDEKMNMEIFENCSVVIRRFFCLKYGIKKLARDDYYFYHDPVFREEIRKVAKKYLIEHQEFK